MTLLHLFFYYFLLKPIEYVKSDNQIIRVKYFNDLRTIKINFQKKIIVKNRYKL